MAGVDVHRAITEEARISPLPWLAPPRLDFNSILTLITSKDCNTSFHGDADSDLRFNWSWKWERTDFKTSSVQCPKALNTLLGKRFSACSSSGFQPQPCSSSSQGCTCNSLSHTNANDGRDHALDAIQSSFLPSTTIPETSSVTQQNKVGDANNSRENVEDDELEEGQIPGEMAEEERQIPGEMSEEEGQIPGEMENEDLTNNECGQKIPMPKISEAKKKPSKSKKRRQNKKQNIPKSIRRSDELPQRRKSGDSKEALKILETVEEKLTQEPVKPSVENAENPKTEEDWPKNQELGGVDVHPTRTGEARIKSTTWLAPGFNVNSSLSLITANDFNTSFQDNSDGGHPFNWSWKWERIDFKTSSVQCPKALNTLLGRRFSACSPSGIHPHSCSSYSHGCTCNSQFPTNTNNGGDSAFCAIQSSLPSSTIISETLPVAPLETQQNKAVNVKNLRENVQLIDGDELKEGQIPSERAKEEDLANNECRQAPYVSQCKSHCFGYVYDIVPNNAIISSQKTPMLKISEARKKPSKAKKWPQKQNKKLRKSVRRSVELPKMKWVGNLNGTLETLESVDKKSTQEPVKQNRENQETPPTKKKDGLSLSSFFEGQVGLWTTETVDEVLRDTKEEAGNKKAKRGPLTAERKAKRKVAKRKKQALKDKQLGVKRLKLAPVTKPKPVILCKFYMKGRCAQGNQCSFSHDAVPATKSEICKYHVNKCCLKGDECPFSHDLSAFPCKFYHTKGYCLEKDMCRFSHKPITENALQDLLKQSEVEKQEFHEQECTRGSIQHFVANNPQTLDEQSKFSAGDQFEKVTCMDPYKSSLRNKRKISEERRASLAFQNPGNGTWDETSNTIFPEEQQISMEKEASLCVSNLSPIPKHSRLSYDLGAEGINDAFFEARKSALNALAAVADHDANLISRGLVRIPTFISSAEPSVNTDMGVDYAGSSGTGSEYLEAHEKGHGEHPVGGNHQLLPSGLLNGSKSAIQLLEDLMSIDTM